MAEKFLVLFTVIVLSVNCAYAVEGNTKGSVPPTSAKLIKGPTPDIEMVYVKGGCYKMGNTFDIGGPEEKPVHEVCVDDFYIGKYEVTQAQWKKIMGSNPSINKDCGDNCPVENVSWSDAQDFISKLNGKSVGGEKSTSKYRLPTESEWEYAARSGGQNEKYSGENDTVDNVAWYNLNTEKTRPVGQKAPNELGIYDMSGNVSEWTNDWYDTTYYSSSPRNNPAGPTSGERRVVRGGSYVDYPFDLRTSYRNYLPPDYHGGGKGFRLLKTVPIQIPVK